MRKFLIAVCLLVLSHSSWAQGLSLSQVTEKLEKAQAKIEDLSATARLDFQVRVGILPYGDSLHGTYLYKKPDRHKLDSPNAPSYLKSVPSMFNWKLPSADKYSCQVTGPLQEENVSVYRLLYNSNNPNSKTASITVTVDAGRWRVMRQDTRYKDGGSVLLEFTYRDWKDAFLLEKVSGNLDLPAYSLKGKAAINLSGHKVNQGLKDSAFD